MGHVPSLLTVDNNINVGKLDWSNLTKADLNKYCGRSDILLGKIVLVDKSMEKHLNTRKAL